MNRQVWYGLITDYVTQKGQTKCTLLTLYFQRSTGIFLCGADLNLKKIYFHYYDTLRKM